MSFNDFFNTPVLAQLLENTLGSTEYKELLNYYSFDKVSFRSFEEITAKFSEVFRVENLSDYSFDYIEVLNRMYKNLEYKEKQEHFKILEDMINEKRINVKNEIGKRGYVIYRNKNYMMLNKKDNEYRNVITFMHELRPCNGK